MRYQFNAYFISRQGHIDDYYLRFAIVECMVLSDQLEFDDNSPLYFVIADHIIIIMTDFVPYRCNIVKSMFGVNGRDMDSEEWKRYHVR